MKYRVKEVISKSGSYFQVQERGFLGIGWCDMDWPLCGAPCPPDFEFYIYSTLEDAQDRIKRMTNVETTKTKYHYQ